MAVVSDFLSSWDSALAAQRSHGNGNLIDLIADDITMGAPPYWKDLNGKLKVTTLLEIILDLIPDFSYHRRWVNGNEIVLEFRGHLGGETRFPVHGVDLIRVNNDGLMIRLDVMIRPLPTLAELKKRVRERITPLLAKL
jgi:hypothetical protein